MKRQPQQTATSKTLSIVCERCGSRFEPTLKERPTPGGGAERRFRCPWCQAWYVVAVITPLGVKLMQQIRQIEAEMKRGAVSDLQERLKDLREQLKPEVSGIRR